MTQAEIRDNIEEAIDDKQDKHYAPKDVWLAVSVKLINDGEMLRRIREERTRERQKPPKWFNESIEEEIEAEKSGGSGPRYFLTKK